MFIILLFKRIAKLRRGHQEQEERQTIPSWFLKLLVQTTQKLRIDRLPAMEIWHSDSPEFGLGISGTELRIPVIKMEDLGDAMAEWGESFAEEMKKWGTAYADPMKKVAKKKKSKMNPEIK